jgi:hypothetical protein
MNLIIIAFYVLSLLVKLKSKLIRHQHVTNIKNLDLILNQKRILTDAGNKINIIDHKLHLIIIFCYDYSFLFLVQNESMICGDNFNFFELFPFKMRCLCSFRVNKVLEYIFSYYFWSS